MAHPGVIADRSRRQRRELVEDLGRARAWKCLLPAHLVGEPCQDHGVRQRLARWVDEPGQVREPPLGVGHHSFLLRPLGGGKEHVGETCRLRRVIGVLDNHELGLPQRLLDEVEVGHRGRRVGAHDPHRAHLTAREALEDFQRRAPGRRRQAPGGNRPVTLDGRARGGVADEPVARQEMGEAAGLAPAHRVRLSGQRERPRPRAADLARRKVQIDDRRVLVRSDVALVDPHRPQGERRPRATESQRGHDDGLAREPRQNRAALGRIAFDHRAKTLPAPRVLRDEACVEEAFAPQHVQHRVQQRDVGAGSQRQVEIGDVGGLGPARVADHDRHIVGRLELPLPDPLEGDRVAVGGVGADQQEAVGEIDVGVRHGRAVGSQRPLVSGCRRGHAEPGVRVEVIGADEPPRELGAEVVLLGEELARRVEGDRVRSVRRDDLAHPIGREPERQLPRHPLELRATAQADLRMKEPVRRSQHGGEMDGFGADVADVGRMVEIASDLRHAAIADLHQEPATHTAVRTHRRSPGVGVRAAARVTRSHAPAPRGMRRWSPATRSSRAARGARRAGEAGGTARRRCARSSRPGRWSS